jgi:serine O-acetyltransferase
VRLEFGPVFENIHQDWVRYADGVPRTRLPRLLLIRGLWASSEYRFGHWARTGSPVWLRPVVITASVFTRLLSEILTGVSIQPTAEIAPGVHLGHAESIVVHGKAVIGAGCTISHEVTIGQDVTPPFGVPKIGRGVYIAPGAKIFGDVTIGDHVAIGANAVVRDDIPDRAIAVGVPARVVRIQEPDEVRAADIAR